MAWQRSQRKSSALYKRNREVIRRRDPFCVRCFILHSRIVPGEECDHHQNIATGGTDDLDNLWSLCKPCHKSKTIREASGLTGFPSEINMKTGWSIPEPDWAEVIRKRHDDWINNITI